MTSGRHVGFSAATAIGIGAIVGGGVLVLSGTAFERAGPAAILAFALNGLIALLTALSYAELATSFPENGGAYLYAQKVLGLRPAFAVGWVLWFAYIAAGVLYALGLAEFSLSMLRQLWPGRPPAWASERIATMAVAVIATVLYSISLIRKASGGGEFANWAKVGVFALLIVLGIGALFFRKDDVVARGLSPFLPSGALGLLSAMGFTFIALQGFEVIGTIGGEVRDPSRTIPRAMLTSLGIGVVVYVGFLFVLSTAGLPPGRTVAKFASVEPATLAARGVGNYLGPTGSWLILLAGVLSTASALGANILAASRVALSMARDRTLPPVFSILSETRGTPVAALYATTLALVAILFMVPDLPAAGAAASLIFLVVFAMTHGIAWLSRARAEDAAGAGLRREESAKFHAPGFPAVQIVGGITCAGLAAFQGLTVPSAGGITIVWLGLGAILYYAHFSARAKVVDASALGQDPELLRLRGHTPTVLVPIANPERARVLLEVASTLSPPEVGRVLLLSVVNPADTSRGDPVAGAERALGQALRASLAEGHTPQALTTVSADTFGEIERVAREYSCQSVLLGAVDLTPARLERFEALVRRVEGNVSFLFARENWGLEAVERVIVPIGGRGSHHTTRARVLGGLLRAAPGARVTFIRVLPEGSTDPALRSAERALIRLSTDMAPLRSDVEVLSARDPKAALLARVTGHDLLLLGLAQEAGRHTFGGFLPKLIDESPCPCLVIARGDESEQVALLVNEAARLLGIGTGNSERPRG